VPLVAICIIGYMPMPPAPDLVEAPELPAQKWGTFAKMRRRKLLRVTRQLRDERKAWRQRAIRLRGQRDRLAAKFQAQRLEEQLGTAQLGRRLLLAQSMLSDAGIPDFLTPLINGIIIGQPA
jgi:hypothetical protein